MERADSDPKKIEDPGTDGGNSSLESGTHKRTREPSAKISNPSNLDATGLSKIVTEKMNMTSSCNVPIHAESSDFLDETTSSPSSSPPRKKLISILKSRMEDDRKKGNMILAHEIAMNEDFKLPDPSDNNTENDSPESDSKRKMEKTLKDVVHKAFWDCIKEGLEKDPPNYEHAFILLKEIKDILLSLLPQNRVTSLHKRIEEGIDLELLRQQADNAALDVRSVGLFVIDTMAAICAPARDELVKALRSIEDTVELFKEVYKVLDQMKIDLANFAIKSVRPHIQHQQFEYERSTFAKLVQRSPDGLKKTRDWILSTYNEISESLSALHDKMFSSTADNTSASSDAAVKEKFENIKKSALSPLPVLKNAYSKLLTWDYETGNFPETLEMDKNRFKFLQKKVQQLVVVSSIITTSCGILGQPIASHKEFLSKLGQSLLTITEPEPSVVIDMKDQLERASIQTWQEAVSYIEGRGPEIESCVTVEKEILLKQQITALFPLSSHPVYSLLYKRTVEYLHLVADSFARKSSSQILPPPPAGISTVTNELVNIALRYSKLVNHNQAVYGPFYVPILRDILGIPGDERKDNGIYLTENEEKALDIQNAEKAKSNVNGSDTSNESPTNYRGGYDSESEVNGKYKVTGSLEDLD